MNISQYQPEDKISGDSKEDTVFLKGMALTARRYMCSFEWCPPIKDIFLAYGIGGILAVFLVRFSEPIRQKDEMLWVITGDAPSAYLVVDNISSPSEAIQAYCELMENWSNAVLQRKSLTNVFPVSEEASDENASLLMRRVNFLRQHIIPLLG